MSSRICAEAKDFSPRNSEVRGTTARQRNDYRQIPVFCQPIHLLLN